MTEEQRLLTKVTELEQRLRDRDYEILQLRVQVAEAPTHDGAMVQVAYWREQFALMSDRYHAREAEVQAMVANFTKGRER